MHKMLSLGRTFFLSVFLIVALSCTHKKNIGAKGCCEGGAASNIERMSKSTVLITGVATQNERKIGEWYGSGAVIAHDEKLGSVILTAGHVCTIQGLGPLPQDADEIKWKLIILDKNEKTQTVFSAFVSPEFDICLAHVPLMDVPLLEFSTTKPKIGDPIINISSPFGIFSKDLSLIFDGYYSGNLQINSNQSADTYSIPSGPGASGSPLINGEGSIVGVISRSNSQFHHIILSPTYEEINNIFSGKAKLEQVPFSL